MRPVQPGIPPEEIGFYKHLDIYMTDNRLKYPPYTKKQMEQAREDLPTFYSATQKYKVSVEYFIHAKYRFYEF